MIFGMRLLEISLIFGIWVFLFFNFYQYYLKKFKFGKIKIFLVMIKNLFDISLLKRFVIFDRVR